MIIGILLFVVFAFFLTQAIFETIWGVCLIINGLFWHAVAFFLHGLAFVLRGFKPRETYPVSDTHLQHGK
jgi:hypothetical protein